MSVVSSVNIGAFYGVCPVEINLVDLFRKTEKEKNNQIWFKSLRKIAIEAPPKTQFKINDTTFTMPSTGIFELGLDFVQIHTLIFTNEAEVNIVYLY